MTYQCRRTAQERDAVNVCGKLFGGCRYAGLQINRRGAKNGRVFIRC